MRRARGEEHMSFGVPRGATGFSMRGIHILSAKHRPKPGDAARRIRKVGGVVVREEEGEVAGAGIGSARRRTAAKRTRDR